MNNVRKISFQLVILIYVEYLDKRVGLSRRKSRTKSNESKSNAIESSITNDASLTRPSSTIVIDHGL